MEPRQLWVRATYHQLKLLVKFMGDNGLLARGVDCRTAIGRFYHDSKWKQVAELLNEQKKGMIKSPRQWNLYWKDLKSAIKKKVKKMRHKCRNINLTGIEQIIYKHYCEKNNIRTRGFAQDILTFTMPNQGTLDDIFIDGIDPRSRQVTPRQILLIIKFMRKHPRLSKPHKKKINRDYHNDKWIQLANILNIQNKAPIKSSKDWRSYWNELQNEVRWKVLRGSDLSKIEKIVYEDMCENNNTECETNEDTASNGTPRVATDSELEEEDEYEEEYLEDWDDQPPPIMHEAEEVIEISDDAEFTNMEQEIDTTGEPQKDCITMVTDADKPGYNDILGDFDYTEELSTNTMSGTDEAVLFTEEVQFIDTEQEIDTSDEPEKDGSIGSTEGTTYQCYAPFIQIIADETVSSSDIRNKIISSFSSYVPCIETVADEPVSNNDTANKITSDINSIINNSNTEVLQDIRNELKELVKLQKDRARTAQMSAAALERTADLEEKKVGLEERRLEMEGRRLALLEKREAGKIYSFPNLLTTRASHQVKHD